MNFIFEDYWHYLTILLEINLAPGKDGYECPVNCPCMPEDQTCDMGFDEYTGCQNAPECMPWKEGINLMVKLDIPRVS